MILAYLSVTALMFTGLLLIFIILLQRGRGGGLAGAFGGAGGQSALGTKAGDVFTKITVGLAIFWVLLACLSIYALRAGTDFRFSTESDTPAVTSEGEPDEPPAPPVAPAKGEETVPGGTSNGTPDGDGAGSGPPLESPGEGATEPGASPAGTENTEAPANP